jgi:hypothetical protein
MARAITIPDKCLSRTVNIIRFFAILIENDTEGEGLVFVKSSTKLSNIYKNIKRLAAKLPKLSKTH